MVINASLRDIWKVTSLIYITQGLGLGVFQYTYQAFLYDHFGGTSKSLSLVISLLVITEVLILFLEVPTGALGDYIGRKKTVILAFACGTVGCFCRTWIYFIPSVPISYVVGVVAVIFYALSYTLFSGSLVAWVVDSIRVRNIPEGHGKILARSSANMIIAKAVGAIMSVFLYLHGYIFYAFALGTLSFLFCCLYCAVAMRETESMNFTRDGWRWRVSYEKMREIVCEGFYVCISIKPIACLTAVYASFMMLIHIVLYMWPIAMKANFGVEKMSFYWFFVVFGSFVTSFLGSKFLEYLNRHHENETSARMSNEQLWNWLAVVCIITAIPVIVLGVLSTLNQLTLFVFVGAIVVFNVGYGFLMPAYDTLINYYIPEKHAKQRATVMSFASMLDSVLMVMFLFPSTGPSGRQTAIGWLVPAVMLIVLIGIVHVLMKSYCRQQRELNAGSDFATG